ncbi:hypothetical protein SK128_021845 [Halocaridina rubra]|uniref:Uncharacterized protein n=1 Tax=Halocaridina rubra TaxID=373956 RepID=A0AAN8XIS6_HALRR
MGVLECTFLCACAFVIITDRWQGRAELTLFLQSEERSRRLLRPSHRSRSEGPLGRDRDDDSLLMSEYKTQYAWVRRGGSARGPEATPLLEAEKTQSSGTTFEYVVSVFTMPVHYLDE